MGETFTVKLTDLQPSQLYICREKLADVLASNPLSSTSDIKPVPVRKLGSKVVLTDGHTRVFAAFQAGLSEIRAYWDTDELDWDAYRVCVEWCTQHDIYSVRDLEERVIGKDEYEKLWYKRCRAMHEELDERRRAS